MPSITLAASFFIAFAAVFLSSSAFSAPSTSVLAALAVGLAAGIMKSATSAMNAAAKTRVVSLPSLLFLKLSWEMKHTVGHFFRAVCCDLTIGDATARQATHEDVYFLVVNSLLVHYIDSNDGNVKLSDITVQCENGNKKSVHKVVGELDHISKRHVRTYIQLEKAEDGCAAQVTAITDPIEVMTIYGLLGSSMTDAATDVPVRAVESRLVAGNSLTHQMVNACRAKLHSSAAMHAKPAPDVEVILQATVVNSMHQYTLSTKLPWRCFSKTLNAELHRRTTPFTLLCRHCKGQDPISAAIYDCCRDIDAVFADEYLSAGIVA